MPSPGSPREAQCAAIGSEMMPDLQTHVGRFWKRRRRSFRCTLPAIGAVPEHPGLFCHFGHAYGLMMVPRGGKIAAIWSLGGCQTAMSRPCPRPCLRPCLRRGFCDGGPRAAKGATGRRANRPTTASPARPSAPRMPQRAKLAGINPLASNTPRAAAIRANPAMAHAVRTARNTIAVMAQR